LAFWAASTYCRVMLSFSSTSTPNSFFLGMLSIHSLPSLYLCLDFPRPMYRTLHLALLNFMRFTQGPPLKPVKVPLDGIPSLQHVNCSIQLAVVSKLAEDALSPTVHVTNKDVKQHWPQYQPLRHTTHHWTLLGHRAIDCNSLSATIQPIPYPLSGPPFKSVSLQFRDKDVVQDSVNVPPLTSTTAQEK